MSEKKKLLNFIYLLLKKMWRLITIKIKKVIIWYNLQLLQFYDTDMPDAKYY